MPPVAPNDSPLINSEIKPMSAPCKTYVTNLSQNLEDKLENYQNLPENDSGFLLKTGLIPGKLGMYESCINQPGMKYYFQKTQIKKTNLFSGVCAPQECDSNDLQVLLVNSTIGQIFPQGSTVNFTEFGQAKED